MIVAPTPPPKDYGIEEISMMLQSAQQLTPYDAPRITQTTIGKQIVPIHFKEDEIPDVNKDEPMPKLHPKILEKMMMQNKYSWVTKPGVQDFFIHDMYKKYTIPSGSHDPEKSMNKEKIFNRPYQYELDYIEKTRQESLRRKVKRNEAEDRKEMGKEDVSDDEEVDEIDEKDVKGPRWIEEPNLTAFVKDDPCQRKKDMYSVGRFFKHEACLWYFKTFPPPAPFKITKRFT